MDEHVVHKKKTNEKLCIRRNSESSKILSKNFEDRKGISFDVLLNQKDTEVRELFNEEKKNYDIIEFSYVILNKKGLPLCIKRPKEKITSGISILQSGSPVYFLGHIPKSKDDMKFYFEQEMKINLSEDQNYDVEFLGIAKNVRNEINYYFFIFKITFPNDNLLEFLSLRKDYEHELILYDNPNEILEHINDKKVDMNVLKSLYPPLNISPDLVEGCIFHEDIDGDLSKTFFKPIVPEIIIQHIDDTQEDWVKVSLVQLNFELDQRFPFKLMGGDKDKVKKKILDALKISIEEKCDIVCFPELCFSKEWIDEVRNFSADKMIICGSYYDSYYNICPIIINEKVYTYEKCHPSKAEIRHDIEMNQGEKYLIFQTKWGKISILNCVDLDYEFSRILTEDVNFIVNPRYDTDRDYEFQNCFYRIKQPEGDYSRTYILQVNATKTKWGDNLGGGGTCIGGFEHRGTTSNLEEDGLKPRGSNKYLFCQAKDEMIMMAKIKINIKKEFESRVKFNDSNWYIYNNDRWEKLASKNIWN